MRNRVAALLFILTATVFAGCFGPGEPGPTVHVDDKVAPAGGVVGVVVDDERMPLENVTIGLRDGPGTRTDAAGRFELRSVVAGMHELRAEHPEYEPVTREVAVLADLFVEVEIVLTKLPALRPYNFTLPAMKGHYDCAAEYLIVTGDCGILYENVTCTVNYCQSDPVWSEKYQFKFDVPPRWQTIVGELVWEESGTSAVEGMRLYLENSNLSTQGGHGKRVARVDGPQQPLAMRYEVGKPHPGAENYDGTTVPAFVPPEGGPQQFRVFPMGNGWGTTRTVCSGGRCLLGVGAAVDLSFTVYVTIFVNEPAPAGYSYVATLPK